MLNVRESESEWKNYKTFDIPKFSSSIIKYNLINILIL